MCVRDQPLSPFEVPLEPKDLPSSSLIDLQQQASDDAPANPRNRKLAVRRLADLSPEPTCWLWHHRIPLGELTIVDGDPGVNKSSVLLDLAARVSTGRQMPDATQGVSGGVLLVLGEDSLKKTVLKRLMATKADLNRMAVPSRTLILPRDLNLLEQAVCEIRARLVVIDPLMTFLGVDVNGDQKVRQAMTPLKDLAERTGAALVMIRHMNKRGGQQAMYRGGGSIGIVASARSALLIAKAPDEPNLRVVCHIKNNLGPLAPSLAFEPISSANGQVEIEWLGECDFTADELLTPSPKGAGRISEAIDFLTDILRTGPVTQREIRARAIQAGLAYRTVERAKEILGVLSNRQGWGPGSSCSWQLPFAENRDLDDHSTPTADVACYDHPELSHVPETIPFPSLEG